MLFKIELKVTLTLPAIDVDDAYIVEPIVREAMQTIDHDALVQIISVEPETSLYNDLGRCLDPTR